MEKTSLYSLNLRRLREAAGLTQEAMAEKIGMSTRGYQKYEQDQASPSEKTRVQIAKSLNCELVDFYKEPGTRYLHFQEAADLLSKISSLQPLRRAAVLYMIYLDDRSLAALGTHLSAARLREFQSLLKAL